MSTSRSTGSKPRYSRLSYAALAAVSLLAAGCERAETEPLVETPKQSTRAVADGKLVIAWNAAAFEVALQADEKYEDPFPHLRAITMMHLAMHDAVNGVVAKYERFALDRSEDSEADATAAAAGAAHAVLGSLYPGQQALIDETLSETTKALTDGTARERGLEVGKASAKAVLGLRASDRSDVTEAYAPSDAPGRHRFVPPFELVYRPAWRNVVPFALAKGDQYRSPPPPSLDSAEYAAAYQEVKTYGRATDSSRTDEQTFYADWWYELSEIGWNRIARVTWSKQARQDLWFTARLFALLNVGLMDAYIAGWDSKLHYDFWRPYTAIRAGADDGNPATLADAHWESHCVTPPVQDYPSTHSALGASAATILYSAYGRDVPFTMESTSSKPAGEQRSLDSFEQAAIENADSRVACGIHFRFATDRGLELGKRVGQHVIESLLEPS